MSSYRRHTVLAVVFESLDKANPCSLSNATVRRMPLFGLDGGGFGDGSEGGMAKVLYAAPV